MVRTKLVPKRVKIRRLPPRAPSIKFKIKSIIPEQKTVQIKKNRKVIKTITVRRKKQNLLIAGQENFNG